jgi:L-arabinose isomerase
MEDKMDVKEKTRKPRVGCLFISSRRFKGLGEGLKDGTYGERTAKETVEIQTALAGDIELVYPGDVYEIADLNRALESFTVNKVDCILALFHSWSEDAVWIRFLRESDPAIPLIYFYPAKESIGYENCADENDLIQFLANGGLVGSLVGSGSIVKLGRTAKIIVGTIQQKKNEIIQYAKLCKIRKLLRQSRFGIMPAYNEVMWNTYIDPYRIFNYGPELTFISYDELAEISEKLPADKIAAWEKELRKTYPLDGSIADEKFTASVRYSMGMWKIFEAYNLDAMTLNDVDMRLFEKIGLRPGFYPDEINRSLAILCPEGDLGMALGMYLLKLLCGKQVNAMEPFYIDASRNLFCGGHAGPNDYNYPESKDYVKISFDARFAKTKYRYAGAPFAWLRIPPGEMTMVHVSQNNNEIKLLASRVESIDGPHRINGYTHSEFRPMGQDISEFFKKIMTVGTTQHFVLVPGDCTDQLADLADLCGFSFTLIV